MGGNHPPATALVPGSLVGVGLGLKISRRWASSLAQRDSGHLPFTSAILTRSHAPFVSYLIFFLFLARLSLGDSFS
jgi:hypothetical protein